MYVCIVDIHLLSIEETETEEEKEKSTITN